MTVDNVIFSMEALDKLIDFVEELYSFGVRGISYDIAANHLSRYVLYKEDPDEIDSDHELGFAGMLYPEVMEFIDELDDLKVVADSDIVFPDEWSEVGLVTYNGIIPDDPRLEYLNLIDVDLDEFEEMTLPPVRHLHVFADGAWREDVDIPAELPLTHLEFRWTQEERDMDFLASLNFGSSSNLRHVRLIGVQAITIPDNDNLDELEYLELDGTINDFALINDATIGELELNEDDLRTDDDIWTFELVKLIQHSAKLEHLGLHRSNLRILHTILPDLKSISIRESIEDSTPISNDALRLLQIDFMSTPLPSLTNHSNLTYISGLYHSDEGSMSSLPPQ